MRMPPDADTWRIQSFTLAFYLFQKKDFPHENALNSRYYSALAFLKQYACQMRRMIM